MHLVHEKTENYLNVFLDDIAKKPDSWRVISIELQECETLYSPLFQRICLKNIQSSFEETECRIYWIMPSFILIFFQGRALPIEKCVEDFLKNLEFKGLGKFFELLDLSIHWNGLMDILSRIKKPQTTTVNYNNINSSNNNHGNTDEFMIHLSPDKIKQSQYLRGNRTKPLLLLVEDDPFTVQLIKISVKDELDIIVAETVRQAISYYQKNLPDMVFQDIQLPDGNGINLLKEMTACDPHAYVVMLSSHTEKEKIVEAMNYGAKGFIAKPFTRQRLLDASIKFKTIHYNHKIA